MATETTDDETAPLLLLFEDGAAGGTEEGAGFPRTVPVEPFGLGRLVLGLASVSGGGGLLLGGLHSGLPPESRKHVYPGAGSSKEVSETDRTNVRRGTYDNRSSVQSTQRNQGWRIVGYYSLYRSGSIRVDHRPPHKCICI